MSDSELRRAVLQHTRSDQSIDWLSVVELFPDDSLNVLKKKWQTICDQAVESSQSSGRIITIDSPFSVNSQSNGHSISPRSVLINQTTCQSLGLDQTVAQFASAIIDLLGHDSVQSNDGNRVFDPRLKQPNIASRKRGRSSSRIAKNVSSDSNELDNAIESNEDEHRCNYQFTYLGEPRQCEQVIKTPYKLQAHRQAHRRSDGSSNATHQCSLCGWRSSSHHVKAHILASHSVLDAELQSRRQPTGSVITTSNKPQLSPHALMELDVSDDESHSLSKEEVETLQAAVTELTQSKCKINWTEISNTLLPHYSAAHLQKAHQQLAANRSKQDDQSSRHNASPTHSFRCDFTWTDDQGVTRQCEHTTDRATNIPKHIQMHQPRDGSYQCSHCGYTSPQLAAVRGHLLRCHSALDAELAQAGLPVGQAVDRSIAGFEESEEEEEGDDEENDQPPDASTAWTEDEDHMLLDAVSAHQENGIIHWTDFQDQFPHRPLEAIQDRYNRQLRGKRAAPSITPPRAESPVIVADAIVESQAGPLPLPDGVIVPAGFVSRYTTTVAETVADKQSYVGDWGFCCTQKHTHNKPDCYAFHGQGKLTMADGVSFFEGNFINGTRFGAGLFDTPKYCQYGEFDPNDNTGIVVRFSKTEDAFFVGGVAGDNLRAGVSEYPDSSRVVGNRFDAQNHVKKTGHWEFAPGSIYRSYTGEIDANLPHGYGQLVLRSDDQPCLVQMNRGKIVRMLSLSGDVTDVPDNERDVFKQTPAIRGKRQRQIIDSDEDEAEFGVPPAKRPDRVARDADIDAPSDLDEPMEPKPKPSPVRAIKWTTQENSIITKMCQLAQKKKVQVDWNSLKSRLPGRDIDAIKTHARELISKLGPASSKYRDDDESEEEEESESDEDYHERHERQVAPVVKRVAPTIPRRRLDGVRSWSNVDDARLMAAAQKHTSKFNLVNWGALEALFPGRAQKDIKERYAHLKKDAHK